MRRIELYVDGSHLVIEECDGRAEVRHASQPRAMAGTSCTVNVGEGEHGERGIPVEVRVESRE